MSRLGIGGCVGWIGDCSNVYNVIEQMEIRVEPKKETWVVLNTLGHTSKFCLELPWRRLGDL